MGSHRTATVSKIMAGTARKDRRRDDDSVKPPGRVKLIAGTKLTIREMKFFKLYASAAVAAVHGEVDGVLIARIAKAAACVEELEDDIATHGRVQTLGTGRKMANPSFQMLMSASLNFRNLLNAAGLSPVYRLKLAPPEGKGGGGGSTAWDDVD